MIVRHEDIDWLGQYFPSLAIEMSPDGTIVVTGEFKFRAVYDPKNGRYLFNPEPGDYGFGVIEDSYNIMVTSFPGHFPTVKDLDGRILSFAEKTRANPLDFHVYPRPFFLRNFLCVAGVLDGRRLSARITLKEFVSTILLPFFYDNSYCEKYDIRPRPAYSHMAWGILENFYETTDHSAESQEQCLLDACEFKNDWEKISRYLTRKKRPKGHHICIFCGKNKIRICHNRLFGALWVLHEGIHQSHIAFPPVKNSVPPPILREIDASKIVRKFPVILVNETRPKWS